MIFLQHVKVFFLRCYMTHYSHVWQNNDEEPYQFDYEYEVFSNENPYVMLKLTLYTSI